MSANMTNMNIADMQLSRNGGMARAAFDRIDQSGNRDGKVTVQEVIAALKEVGIQFSNQPINGKPVDSGMVIADFAGRDGNPDFSPDELQNLLSKNPQIFNGLKIHYQGKEYTVQNGAFKEYLPLVPAPDTPKAEKKDEATVPVASTHLDTYTKPQSNPLVEKHLVRFKQLFNIENDAKAREYLARIFADPKASRETINSIIKELGREWSFSEAAFNAFGKAVDDGRILTPDEFLTNVEVTIFDIRGSYLKNSTANAELMDYAKSDNFCIINANSNFGKTNIAVFRQQALKALKEKDPNTPDSLDLAEIIKRISEDTDFESGNAVNKFLKDMADKIKTEQTALGANFDEKDQAKRDELNKELGRRIHVALTLELMGKSAGLQADYERFLGFTPESVFRNIYFDANGDPKAYEKCLTNYFKSGGDVVDLKELRRGPLARFMELFQSKDTDVVVNQGGATVPVKTAQGGKV